MTNGEKIIEIIGKEPLIDTFGNPYILFNKNWWNAECKESTTKNDLGVDCISRADAITAMQNKAKKLKNEDTINGLCGAVAILFDLPSVTPQEPILDKIRAEIERGKTGLDIEFNGGIDYALSIIDKYKAEREG